MDFLSTCRTCLNTKGLNPIFQNPDDYQRYSSALLLVAGIKVETDDGLPQKMCTDCINTINNALKFRKQCKDVEIQLLEQKTILDNVKIESQRVTIGLLTNNSFKTDATLKKDIKVSLKTEIVAHNENKPLKNFNDDSLKLYDSQCDDNGLNTATDTQDMVQKNLSVKTVTKQSEKHKEAPYRETFSIDSKKQRVTCKMCLKDLSKRSIDAHMARLHPGADERKVKCELCDAYVFGDKLKRHVLMMHGERGFGCGYCKTEFASRELLVEHVASCTFKTRKRKANDAGRQLQQCGVCNKTMQRASLRTHIAVKHAGLGPVCEHCGKKFGNKFRLNEHYRAKHGYEKFRCSYCDFQSAGIMSMRNHERRHRGEKPFVCEECGAKFHAAYLLAQHKQSHRSEKLIKCSSCPARFKARYSLHAHRQTRHARATDACGTSARALTAATSARALRPARTRRHAREPGLIHYDN